MYEQKDNTGVLFKNERKDRDTHPDYTGNALIDGREYWISAWLKEGKKGKFFSFSFKPKDFAQKEQNISQRAAAKIRRPNEDMDDSIPFAPEFR